MMVLKRKAQNFELVLRKWQAIFSPQQYDCTQKAQIWVYVILSVSEEAKDEGKSLGRAAPTLSN